jgi:predicted aminopeptidase
MRSLIVLAGLGCALVQGCVTINIYFPAAAAEKAADKIIDEVWQLKPDQKAPAPDPQAK